MSCARSRPIRRCRRPSPLDAAATALMGATAETQLLSGEPGPPTVDTRVLSPTQTDRPTPRPRRPIRGVRQALSHRSHRSGAVVRSGGNRAPGIGTLAGRAVDRRVGRCLWFYSWTAASRKPVTIPTVTLTATARRADHHLGQADHHRGAPTTIAPPTTTFPRPRPLHRPPRLRRPRRAAHHDDDARPPTTTAPPTTATTSQPRPT
jgi:hypothetical protein